MLPGADEEAGGVWGSHWSVDNRPELFENEEVRRFPLAPLLFAAAERGQLSGELHEGVWEDVGTIERLERLNETLHKPEGAL